MRSSIPVIPAYAGIQKHKNWMPACAGMTILFFCAAAQGADSLLPETGDTAEFLPVDEAFQLVPLDWRDDRLVVEWRIAPDYYLYRRQLGFTLVEPPGAALGAARLPEGEKHEDEFFGKTEVYRDSLRAELPYRHAAGKRVKLKVVYQGCADAGLCYPPQTRTLEAVR